MVLSADQDWLTAHKFQPLALLEKNHNYILYVLVKAPCEYTTGIIECGCGRENEAKQSALSFLETATGSIISVVYERKRCFNWLVAQSTCQDRSKLAR